MFIKIYCVWLNIKIVYFIFNNRHVCVVIFLDRINSSPRQDLFDQQSALGKRHQAVLCMDLEIVRTNTSSISLRGRCAKFFETCWATLGSDRWNLVEFVSVEASFECTHRMSIHFLYTKLSNKQNVIKRCGSKAINHICLQD